MRSLFEYLISDLSLEEKKKYYNQFINIVNNNKDKFKFNNSRALKSINTIYESGYEWQRWLLNVCLSFVFFALFLLNFCGMIIIIIKP